MTSEKGIPYQRHKPSAALREFLDPLDPGAYFDCGRARLHGLDDALLKEAESRGRTVGDDSFQLVATDMGLIFCRPSISFAIAARWEEVMLIRPHGDDPVVLPVTWPTHGELKFTVSKRLAGNVFRRWLQLRMQAARLARREAAEQRAKDHDEQSPTPAPATASPAKGSHSNASPPNASVAADSVIEVDLVAEEAASTAKSEPIDEIDLRSNEIVVIADDHLPVPAESGDDWELVAKVEPAGRPEPDPDSDPSVVERRDTGPPANRRQLDEDGAAKRRVDRPTMLEVFEAETTLPITDRPDLPDGVLVAEVEAGTVVANPDSPGESEPAVGPTLEATEPFGGDLPPPPEEVVSAVEARPAVDTGADTSAEIDDHDETDPNETESKPESASEPVAVSAPKSVFETGPGLDDASSAAPVDEPSDEPVDDLIDVHAWPVPPKRSRSTLRGEPSPAADSDRASEPDAGAARDTNAVVPVVRLDDIERPVAVGDEPEPTPPGERDPEPTLVAAGDLQHGSLRTIAKPETTQPSWVGSPMSLVATVVAVSSFVLVLTLAVSVLRDDAEPAQVVAIDGSEAAGPSLPVGRTTIDHQRFKPGSTTSVPLRSAALTPTGSSVSDTANPPSEPDPSAATGEPTAADDVLGNQPRLCNSNYSGCVPDVSDVDCPGDGDGPVFAEGQAIVMGDDIYGLDTDDDGETCEADQPLTDGGDATTGQEAVTAEAGVDSP